jgi:hypothetical protein
MNARGYLAVSGSVFGLVAILHLLRVINGWEVVVGPWSAPMAVSWLGTIFLAFLSVWAFRLATRAGA